MGQEKAIIILGPRQTGKTTLLQKIVKDLDSHLFLDCDDPSVREQLENANTFELKRLLGNNSTVFIDEAQRVRNIGLTLKIITDQFKGIQVLVSGSSALDLASEINEPLTGRKWEYSLFPISWEELYKHYGHLAALQQFESRLIYGMYPEVVTQSGNEVELLRQLSGSYLYKDILAHQGIRKPELLEKLLRALALQLGNEVSYNELARLLEVDKNTVSSYLNLLEKTYIIFRLQPFRRNLRTEIGSSRKIYFYDNGIRNALVANFNPLNLRQDTGALWENFLISERMKAISYKGALANTFYWRTRQQQEIDYIEERDGKLFAYEFKWNKKKEIVFSKTFINAYPDSKTKTINPSNFMDFLAS